MPIRAGNFDAMAERFGIIHQDEWYTVSIVAKLDDFDIRKHKDFYSVWDSDVLIFFMKTRKKNADIEIDDIWTLKEYRGKRIFSKMIAFLKTREKVSRIFLGSVHSDDTFNLIKNGGFKSFTKYWLNSKTNIRSDFDIADVEQYYNSREWIFVLENEIDYGNYPRFNGDGYIKESYDILLNVLDV